MFFVNNKLAVKPYEIKGLTAEVRGGVAFAKQAQNIVALEAVFDGSIGDTKVSAGDLIFFEERTLNEEGWAKKKLYLKQDDDSSAEFILADANKVVGIKKLSV